MANTEKPSTKAEQKKQGAMPSVQANKPKVEKQKIVEKKKETEDTSVAEPKPTEKKDEKKETKKPKEKKTSAVVNAYDVHISTKKAIAVCKFVKGKRIGDAIRDLEEVVKLKTAVPMSGEIPHRKGKIAGGRFPQKTAKAFTTILKGLAGNSSEMDDPIITEAVANFAARPLGRFGRVKKKRTHIKIVAKERGKKLNKKKQKKK